MGKIVGIIGGMGPESTIRLMEKIVKSTPVKREQDHIRLIVDNNPAIPDRTDYLLENGPSPLPMLIESARLLQDDGAQLIAIACNTAHAFIQEIRDSIGVPVLDMLGLTAGVLKRKFPSEKRFLLLTTSGSLAIELFQKYLNGYHLKIPNTKQQDEIMQIIYGKSGVKCAGVSKTNRIKLIKIITQLIEFDLSGIIAGCTEIGLTLEDQTLDLPVIDPLDVLAREIVQRAASD